MAKFHETLNKKLFDGDKMRTETENACIAATEANWNKHNLKLNS